MYYVVINGKPKGPYALEELATLNITAGTFIKKLGMDDYKEAHELKELRGLLGLETIYVSPQYFASFERRLMAFLVDIFSMALIHTVAIAIAYQSIANSAERIAIIQTAAISFSVVFYVYAIIADASRYQGTFGKMALGIKVTDELGKRIKFSVSIARNLGKIVSNISLGLGYLICIFSKRNQCLHDMMAKTLVVKDRLF